MPRKTTSRPDPAPLIIFGYGSLMWAPGFAPSDSVPAKVIGWHRRFSLLSTLSWGSPDRPGLCAALHPGGTGWGRALSVPETDRVDVLAYLDEREAAYRRRVVHIAVKVAGGTVRRRAVTYVADPGHPRMRADIGPEAAHVLIRQGRGNNGTSLDYLRNTVAALSEDGHRTSDAHRILDMIGA